MRDFLPVPLPWPRKQPGDNLATVLLVLAIVLPLNLEGGCGPDAAGTALRRPGVARGLRELRRPCHRPAQRRRAAPRPPFFGTPSRAGSKWSTTRRRAFADQQCGYIRTESTDQIGRILLQRHHGMPPWSKATRSPSSCSGRRTQAGGTENLTVWSELVYPGFRRQGGPSLKDLDVWAIVAYEGARPAESRCWPSARPPRGVCWTCGTRPG